MNILFLSSWFPCPPANGSQLRIYHLLRGLTQHHRVTLLSFAEAQVGKNGLDEARTLCHEVQTVPVKQFRPESRRARLAFLRLTPRSLLDTFSHEMNGRIAQALQTQRYDLVIASQLGVAVYASAFRGVAALFEEAEVGLFYERFAYASSVRARLRHGLTWLKHRRFLRGLLGSFRACTVASEKEQRLLGMVAPGYRSVHVLPNCVRIADYQQRAARQPNELIFTGSFRYWPNYEAMQWFVGEVYPRIQAQIPDVTLTITGEHADRPLPAAPGVSLTGLVDDVRPLLARAAVSVVPLHSGGGTRLKVLEAMASGTPVVSTSKGAEGLDLEGGVHLLKADESAAFADAVVRVVRDQGLRQRLATAAYRKVATTYDWDATMPHFLKLVDQAAAWQTG